MPETLLQKAQRLGIKPAGVPPIGPTMPPVGGITTQPNTSPLTPPTQPIAGETLLQKAQRLGIKPATPPELPVPGSETAMMPASPANKIGVGNAATGEALKIVPNALKDTGMLLKETTYGTAKKLAYEIPKETLGLLKEQGIKGVGSFVQALPQALVDTVWNLIPQSAKEIANVKALTNIPDEYKALAKESGGYFNAFTSLLRQIPKAVVPGIGSYLNNLDRARQAFQNHPVNEVLGYWALKGLVEDPTGTVNNIKESLNSTGEFIKNPLKSTQEAVGGAVDTVRATLQKKYVNDIADTYREVAGGTKKASKTLSTSEARGKDPAQVLADRGIVPEIREGKMRTETAQAKINAEAQPLNEHLNLALDEVQPSIPKTKIADVRARALNQIDDLPGYTESAKATMKTQANKEFDLVQEKLGPEITLKQLNDVKKTNWLDTRFDSTNPYKGDASYQIGRAAKLTIEDSVPKDAFSVHDLNDYIGDLYDAKKFLGSLEGNAVKGGRLGRYFGRVVGATIGHSIPIPGGSIVGALGGDVVAEILQSTTFSNPMKAQILRDLQTKDPVAYQQALKFVKDANVIKESRLRLPAPRAPGTPENPLLTTPPTIFDKQAPKAGEPPKGSSGLGDKIGQFLEDKNIGLQIKPVKIHPEDLATMSDFTDYVAGSYKPTPEQAQQLELAASRIAERYAMNAPKTIKGLASEFGRQLDLAGFKRPKITKLTTKAQKAQFTKGDGGKFTGSKKI